MLFPLALWMVSFNGKSVVNRLLDNGWSNLNDFKGRPHEFYSGQMLKKQPTSTSVGTSAEKSALSIQPFLAYFGPNVLRFSAGEIFSLRDPKQAKFCTNVTQGVQNLSIFVSPFLSTSRQNIQNKKKQIKNHFPSWRYSLFKYDFMCSPISQLLL